MSLPRRFNLMHPIRWVPDGAADLLDVGCNIGAFLSHCREVYPDVRLSGVEIHPETLEVARRNVPGAELHASGAECLPFADESFDCVTCIEVLEHIPAELRAKSLSEMRRVLRPGGRLVLRVPHAGAVAFMDSNNFRFRFPWLYRRLVGRGLRDNGYADPTSGVVWHHHFTREELLALAGEGWEVETWRSGGLIVANLVDLLRWPFYRTGRGEHAASLALERIGNADLGLDYGRASSTVLMVLRKARVVA